MAPEDWESSFQLCWTWTLDHCQQKNPHYFGDQCKYPGYIDVTSVNALVKLIVKVQLPMTFSVNTPYIVGK